MTNRNKKEKKQEQFWQQWPIPRVCKLHVNNKKKTRRVKCLILAQLSSPQLSSDHRNSAAVAYPARPSFSLIFSSFISFLFVCIITLSIGRVTIVSNSDSIILMIIIGQRRRPSLPACTRLCVNPLRGVTLRPLVPTSAAAYFNRQLSSFRVLTTLYITIWKKRSRLPL